MGNEAILSSLLFVPSTDFQLALDFLSKRQILMTKGPHDTQQIKLISVLYQFQSS